MHLQTSTDGSIARYCLKACLNVSRCCRNRSGVAEAGYGICPLVLAAGMAFFLPSFSYRRYSVMWNRLPESERQLHECYPDMPPEALMVQHLRNNVCVDLDELQRAQWFWGRRPKKLILCLDKAVKAFIFYLTLWIMWISFGEQVPVADVIQCVAWIALAVMSVALLVDVSRYAQWKWEYCSAISRLFATVGR
jgi:hypothetical protein